MKWFIQILGAATHDSRPSVMVHFDSQRYLFNCGEGIQRLCNDQKVRLSKLRSLFLTRLSWDCMGGLPGLVLTVADAGSKQIKIHGPGGLTHALAGMRQFLYRPSFPVEVYEIPEDLPEFKDENLTVTPILLYPDTTTSHPQRTSPRSRSRSKSPTHARSPTPPLTDAARRHLERAIVSNMFDTSAMAAPSAMPELTMPASDIEKLPAAKCRKAPGSAAAMAMQGIKITDRLPRMEQNRVSVAYVCRGPDVPGKLDPVAAKKLGVKVGSHLGRLSRGESVTLENGTVVHSHQCVAPPKPGSVFCVIDCPSPSYVPSIVSAPKLKASSLDKNLKSIVHILGTGVLDHPDYKAWMGSFGADTQHIVASADHTPCETLLHSTANINSLLNCIDSDVFPLPYSSTKPETELSAVPNLPKSTLPSRPQLIHQLEPKAMLDYKEVPKPAPPPDPAAYPLLRQCMDEMEEVRRKEAGNGDAMAVDGHEGCGHHHRRGKGGELVVVPLGTGAAIPSKYRNVSSTLLMLPEGNVILDSGEGTLSQMFRHFGPGKFEEELRRLRLLFVSHLHADHHLGTIGLLKRRRMLDINNPAGASDKLYVLAPRTYLQWLSEYADCEDFGLDTFVLVPSEEVAWAPARRKGSPPRSGKAAARSVSPPGAGKAVSPTVMEMMTATGMTHGIQTVGVIHCPAAYGVVLRHRSGESYVFSGDCRPTPNLVTAGHGATLLIHEATLEDEKQAEAVEKRHCTTSEAIQVAKNMEAENVLLTHFSQRYPKIPKLQDVSDNTQPASTDPVLPSSPSLGPTHHLADASSPPVTPTEASNTLLAQNLLPSASSRKRKHESSPSARGAGGEPRRVAPPVVGIAFDSMRIRLEEFGRLPGLMGPLKTLWSDLSQQEGEA
ncbi:Zinc phosphodiesterase ELAC protein 2 [Phlyctochytrium bullatum]|nr:Zinc phosphodiesterase ELAC protein 2 [Phlyctochytrium bullatum]